MYLQMISSGAHCVAVPLGMSKAGRLGPAPPAPNPGNPSTPTRLPPPFSRVQSIPKPSVTDDRKANHHLNAQQKWMENFLQQSDPSK